MLVRCGDAFPSHDQPRWGWNGMQMRSPHVGTRHHSFLMHGGAPLFRRLLPYKHWCKLYGWPAHIAPPVLRVVPCKTNLIWPQSKVRYIFLNLQSFGSQSNHEYNGELGNIQDFMREWYLFSFFFLALRLREVRAGNNNQHPAYLKISFVKKWIMGKDLRSTEKPAGLYRVANWIQHIPLIALSSWELPLDCRLWWSSGSRVIGTLCPTVTDGRIGEKHRDKGQWSTPRSRSLCGSCKLTRLL